MSQHPYLKSHELRDGRIWIDGEHCFLKTGKPLRNYADGDQVATLQADLPIIAAKGYNNLSLNCYWHHFNPSGDGRIEVSLDPLKELVQAIRDLGMHVSLSVETYGVGGGHMPHGFVKNHPEALAVNHMGRPVRDTEYGYDTIVPSLFSPVYLSASRAYMKNLVAAIGAGNFLYLETTVEPQYMGAQWLDFNETVKVAYEKWLDETNPPDASPFPATFPVRDAFLNSENWNQFRARNLAEWVNGDARALREGAGGKRVWIATDYLDAEEKTMTKRCGNALEFLCHLEEPDIIQINWSWCNIRRKPNQKAYDRVHRVMEKTGRDWAITEHMTINGADYYPDEMEQLLENTLKNGTHFGWEFVDIAADRDDPSTVPNQVLSGDFKPQHFAVYDADWNPKPPMQVVENNWDKWMETEASLLAADAHYR